MAPSPNIMIIIVLIMIISFVVVMITMITSIIMITITRTEKEVVLYMWSLRDCKKPLRKKHRTW